MATVKLITRGKNKTSTLYIRFVNGRSTDLTCSLKIQVNTNDWCNKRGNYKNKVSIAELPKKQAKFQKFKASILEQYNDSFMLGDVIDGKWLKNAVKIALDRPKHEIEAKTQKHFIYFSEFSKWWLSNKASAWKTKKDKSLSKNVIKQYQAFVNLWERFEAKDQIKVKDLGNHKIIEFRDFMARQNYSASTIKRQIKRAKFFLNRANSEGLKTNPSFNDHIYVEQQKESVSEPYLNEEEIDRIFDLELSHDINLDNIRDNMIIGLWTGLRISDFNKNLNVDNIDDDFISIKTQKTGAWVKIPLHPQVKIVLDKRFGNLPMRFSNKFFNEQVKVICMLAEIDQKIKGGKVIVDRVSNQKRKVIGLYKKYELVSSHICRRSFTTNLFGKISNHDLMKLAGWSEEKMMLHYVKKTTEESAMNLKKYWEGKYS